jgi:hypothetical protein
VSGHLRTGRSAIAACAAGLLLASGRAAADDAPPAEPTPAAAPATAAAPVAVPIPPAAATPPAVPPPPAPLDAAEPVGKGFSLLAGWGYYEEVHLGAAYHFTDRAAGEIFGGGGGFTGGAKTTALGAAFSHAIGAPVWGMGWGWDAKALYWTRSDPNYDWTMLSLLGGAYLSRSLARDLTARVDAGVAFTLASQSDRKQNENFGHPQRWNGSVCVDLLYRFGAR